MIGLALAVTASAAVATLTAFSAVPISPLEATVTATVGNGGTPPIYYRGFVYAETAYDDTPLRWEGHNDLNVPGTVGVMTRNLTGLRPNISYSVQAYAENPSGIAYSGVQSFVTPCPVVTLPPLPDGAVGQPYFSYVTAFGSFGWDDYVVTAGTLPDGVDLYAYGSYAYVWAASAPTTPGTFNFTITAFDLSYGTGCFASRNYSVTIGSVDVSPRKLDFASELVGVPSAPKTVTITNNSGGDVTLALPFVITGPFSESAPSSAPCTNPLPSPGSCTVDVVFTPPTAAVHTGGLALGPATVSLRGAGTAALIPQVYVSNTGANTVSVIDPATNTVRVVVPVGSEPRNLAALPGGGKVYVPNRFDPSVSVISTATNTVVKTITDASFSEPYAVAPSPLGDEVWVVNKASTDLTIIDTATDNVAGVVDGEGCLWNPEGIVANPRTHEVYVMSRGASSICVFDRLTRLFTREINIGGDPRYGVVLPDGSALYVDSGYDSSSSSYGVSRVALPSGTVTYISGADGRNMDMKADGSKIYVARQGNGFGVINTAANVFTDVPLSGASSPYGVAVHDAAGRVYVSDEDQEVVYVVDLATDAALPNPELPINDPSFNTPRAIASIKAPPPAGPFSPPSVTTLPGTANSVSASVSGNVTATGGAPIFERGFAYSDTDTSPEPGEAGVFTVIAPGPPGLGLMPTTLLGLTPNNTLYHYQAYAKNIAGTGLGGVDAFTTTGACLSIEIDPSTLPNGIVGSSYSPSTPFTATGAGGPYAFSYVGLPPGLTGSSGGVLSGTPATAGTYTVEVVATEAVTGCWASRTMDVVIGTPVSAGSVVISEFRTHGPGTPAWGEPGDEDDYVEIGNRTSGDIVVASTDGSGGWSIGRPGEVVAFIPDGTVIKKGGHWLATGLYFSLYYYGAPDYVYWGDEDLWNNLPDDTGIALFTTADFNEYKVATRLDAVGGVKETDPLFWEGTPLAEAVQAGSADPGFQVAWVRRVDNSGILSDTGDNERDFIFVATDAGTNYGPAGDFPAVLGGPGPEDSYTVHDVLQSEFTASLLDPAQGQDRQPNRVVIPWQWGGDQWVDYRRVFKNNTGQDITALAFKVINVTTLNSRATLATQARLMPATAPPVQLEVPLGSNNYVDLLGSDLDFENMYPLTAYYDYDYDTYRAAGGMNSRLIVPFGGRIGPQPEFFGLKGPVGGVLPPGESLGVNFRAVVYGRGYYLWVVLPQISFDVPCGSCDGVAEGVRAGAVKPSRERRERAGRPAGRR